MSPALIEKGIPALIALLGGVVLALWVRSYIRAPLLPERPFGLDHPPAVTAQAEQPSTTGAAASSLSVPAATGAIPTASPGAAASSVAGSGGTAPALSFYNPAVTVPNLPGRWPGFRGENRDNVSVEAVPLARPWGPQGPKVLWTVNVGEGYAAAAIRNGRVYVLDYDQGAKMDALRCFSLADGTEIWRRSYPALVKRNHGMSRTIPAVTDKYVVSLGPKCHVLCADAITGAVKWTMDLVRDFGATVPEWYAGQCPLIDGDRVILAPGGKALMIAVDLASGKVIWQTPNPKNWQMTHSSIVPVEINGKRMYVYCASGGVVGVSAKDGRLLWETTEWTIDTATVPSPVPVGEGRIFLTGGYNAGSLMLQVQEQGGQFRVQTLFRTPPTVFGSDQQTPIHYKGYIYGVIPGGELACLDLSGKVVWRSGSTQRFGLGPYLIAGGMIYALNDRGKLTLIEATPSGYKPVAEAQILEDAHECWGPLALAGGRLIARDLTRIVCLDVAQ